MDMDPVVGWSMPEGTPQHRPSGRERRRELGLEAELELALGDGRDVGRLGGQQQVDGVLAGQSSHRRAADMLGGCARPAGRDERDEASGGLGGVRIGLVDLNRDAEVAADRWVGRRGPVGVGWARAGEDSYAVHWGPPPRSMARGSTAAVWRGPVTGWRRRHVAATAKGTRPGRVRRSDRARPVMPGRKIGRWWRAGGGPVRTGPEP